MKRVHIHVHERKARDAMSFIEVLNDTEGRRLIDAIEDTRNSLRAHGGKDSTLEAILKNQVAELKRKTGFTYQVSDEASAIYKSHRLSESGGKWRITTPGMVGKYGEFDTLADAKRKIDELIATGYPQEPTRDAEGDVREGMNMVATINGRRVKVRIIGVDSDPRANVWVVERDDPDKGHFVQRAQLTRDAAATGKDYLWNIAVMMAKEGQTQAYLEAYLKADKKLKPSDIAYAVQVFNERKPIEEINRRNRAYDAEPDAQLIGKRVRFKTPGPNGPMTVVGTVKAGVRPGELEVKSQQGGYYKLAQVGQYEVLDAAGNISDPRIARALELSRKAMQMGEDARQSKKKADFQAAYKALGDAMNAWAEVPNSHNEYASWGYTLERERNSLKIRAGM